MRHRNIDILLPSTDMFGVGLLEENIATAKYRRKEIAFLGYYPSSTGNVGKKVHGRAEKSSTQ